MKTHRRARQLNRITIIRSRADARPRNGFRPKVARPRSWKLELVDVVVGPSRFPARMHNYSPRIGGLSAACSCGALTHGKEFDDA